MDCGWSMTSGGSSCGGSGGTMGWCNAAVSVAIVKVV